MFGGLFNKKSSSDYKLDKLDTRKGCLEVLLRERGLSDEESEGFEEAKETHPAETEQDEISIPDWYREFLKDFGNSKTVDDIVEAAVKVYKQSSDAEKKSFMEDFKSAMGLYEETALSREITERLEKRISEEAA